MLAADLDFQKAHETCVGLPHATPHKADVTKREDIEALLAKHDQIDVYFNNAGIPETVKPLAEISREEWDTVLDVNLTSLFIAAQVAAPKLKGGVLIQTGSIIANRPRAGLAAYVAAKSGVIGLARALAAELAPGRARERHQPRPGEHADARRLRVRRRRRAKRCRSSA